MDLDYPTYEKIRDEQVKARKSHICDLCRKPIEIGTTYRRHTFTQDGELAVMKNHIICVWDDACDDSNLPF